MVARQHAGAPAVAEELAAIRENLSRVLDLMVDRESRGGPITLPDGSTVPRLPSCRYWIWDGEFCGVVGFRWQPGTAALPAHVLGHVGYAVVPWKRGRGYATEALRQFLPIVRAEGLPFIELVTEPSNVASQKVIEANGGVLVERFAKGPEYGGREGLRYRIAL